MLKDLFVDCVAFYCLIADLFVEHLTIHKKDDVDQEGSCFHIYVNYNEDNPNKRNVCYYYKTPLAEPKKFTFNENDFSWLSRLGLNPEESGWEIDSCDLAYIKCELISLGKRLEKYSS